MDINNNILNNIKDININKISKDNKYINQYGAQVPRVTEILSTMIHSESLMGWANNLGFKRINYRDKLNEAAEYGSLTHESIEVFLKTNEESSYIPSFNAFKRWYDILNKNHIVHVIYSEKELVCDYYGGTCDLVLSIDGRYYLIDFKTSNHITYKHFLQLGAYEYMLWVNEGIQLSGTIILQLSKNSPDFNEFVLEYSIPEHRLYMNHCINTFHYLVNGYYYTLYAEQQFKNILKGN